MLKIEIPENELLITFSKSGGPGGQNVNKLNTKVILHWNYQTSHVLDQESKIRFLAYYSNNINDENFVVIISQEHRTQKGNVDSALEKLKTMIAKAMIQPKIRKKTKPKRSAVLDRLKTKKKDSDKKKGRREKHY
jgi:ribosome-associated protein